MTLGGLAFTPGRGQPGPNALALADLSSLAPSIKVPADVSDALLLILDLLGSALRASTTAGCGQIIDVDLRIYGGFFAHDGTSTEQYQFLLKTIRKIQGLHGQLRVLPTAVTALACRPAAKIVGTYRGGRQRMVDQMLAQDLRYLGPSYDLVTLLADDEDYFPPVLACAIESRTRILWLRQRTAGRNDAHLQGTSVTTSVDPLWQSET